MTTIVAAGKSSFSLRDTSRSGRITISRSFFVVSSRISGGCMNTTLAM